MKKALQTIYLRIDSGSKSLTKRALSQLILKIIHFFIDPPSKKEILSNLNSILGTNISREKIGSAMEILLSEGKISEAEGKYIISPATKEKIDIAVREFVNRQRRIIEKYFSPIRTPTEVIAEWFEDVTIEFFNEYGSEWISDLCLTTNGALKSKHKGIQIILDSITENNKNIIAGDRDWLKNQYLKVLQSNDNDVNLILWDYGTSRFSSSLIIANTSVDPITIEEFKNSKCILDTNILMYLDLEKGQFAESFKSMETIFTNLNIAPVYFYATRDEFIRTMEHKKNDVLKVVNNFSHEVLATAEDPFLQTAMHRGCINTEDFERFFDQLLDLPKFVSELLEIKVYDNAEINDAVDKGQNDTRLKERINKVYKKKHHQINKKKNALIHDAGLITGAEECRKKEKCFILSRDASINEVALENPTRNEMPIAISLNTLINLLAIDNGGTDIDPTNCAPLFASLIKLALIPEHGIFRLEDLSKLVDIEKQIGDLEPEVVIDIAKEYHHNTVTGISEEETTLQVNRRFQKEKLRLQSDLEKSQQQTHFEKEEKERFIRISEKATNKLREKYTGDFRDKYDKQLRNDRIKFFLVLPLITTLTTGALIYFYNSGAQTLTNHIIGFAINIAAWLLTDFLFLHKKITSKYSERINGINEEVEMKIRESIRE